MASDIVKTLRYVILGDATKLSNSLRSSSRDLRGFAKGGAVLKTLKSDIVSAVKSGKGLQGVAKGIGDSFKTAGTSVGGLAGAAKMGAAGVAVLAAAAVAAGAAIAIKFGQDSVSTFKRVAGEVLALKRVTGMTAEESSRLAFSFKQTGVDAGAGNKAVTIFTKNLGKMADQDEKAKAKAAALAEKTKDQIAALKGAGKHGADYNLKLATLKSTLETATAASKMNVSALGEIGVKYADSTGKMRPMAKLLPEIANWFEKTKDGPEKSAMAMKLFGKSGTALIPFLNKGAAGLKDLADKSDRFGNTLNDKQLDALKKSKAAQRDWDAAMQGLQVTLGANLLPLLTQGAEMMNSVLIPAIEGVSQYVHDNQSTFDAMGRVAIQVWNSMLLPMIKGAIIGFAQMNKPLASTIQGLGMLTGNKDLETFGAGLVKASDDATIFALSLKGIPDQVAPKVDVKDQATPKVKKVDSEIKSLKGKIVTAKAKGDDSGLAALKKKLAAAEARKYKLTAEVHSKLVGGNTIALKTTSHGTVKLGILAAGGISRFSGGGENHQANVYRRLDGIRVFNEPETGGESYIPLANDWRRPRAISIWKQTGRELGVFAAGGIRGGSRRAASTVTLELHVHAAPAQQPAEVWKAVRKGLIELKSSQFGTKGLGLA